MCRPTPGMKPPPIPRQVRRCAWPWALISASAWSIRGRSNKALIAGPLDRRAALHAGVEGICHADGELVAAFNHSAAAVEGDVSQFFGRMDGIAILVFHDADHLMGAHIDD